MPVVVVTPPEPIITLAEAKQHLRVDDFDNDVVITALVAAATATLDGPDGRLGRAIGLQVLEEQRSSVSLRLLPVGANGRPALVPSPQSLDRPGSADRLARLVQLRRSDRHRRDDRPVDASERRDLDRAGALLAGVPLDAGQRQAAVPGGLRRGAADAQGGRHADARHPVREPRVRRRARLHRRRREPARAVPGAPRVKAGANMNKLTIERRAADADGRNTGDFAGVITTWCRWTQNAGVMAQVNGQREDKIDLLVTVNDSCCNRTIGNSDRAVLLGTTYEIDTVGLPERKSGTISLMLKRAMNG